MQLLPYPTTFLASKTQLVRSTLNNNKYHDNRETNKNKGP